MTLPVVQSVIQIGPVSIHWYGLLVVVGMCLGYLVVRYLNSTSSHRYPLSTIDSLAFALIIWGFVGARLYHVLNEPIYYWNHPIDIFKVWNGGLAIHGAIIGGVLAVCYFVRRWTLSVHSETGLSNQESRIKNQENRDSYFVIRDSERLLFRKTLFIVTDLLVIGLALGQAIGRWGNYFNQELFGKPTNGFFKVFIDITHRPIGFENIAYYHPTFFYESVLNVVLFVILLLVHKHSQSVIPGFELASRKENKQKKTVIASERERSVAISDFDHQQNEIASSQSLPRNDNKETTGYGLQVTGYVTAFYFLGYGLIRFFVDFLRIDPRPFFGGLYLSQWVSLIIIVIGVWIWYNLRRKYLTLRGV